MPYPYLAQWERVTEGDMSFWQMPRVDIGLGSLDLRSIPQMSKIGGIPEGFGLFILSQRDDTVGYPLGDSLTQAKRLDLRNLLKFPDYLASSDLASVISELRTVHSDVTGENRWGVAIPDLQGRIGLSFKVPSKGSFEYSEPFDLAKHTQVLPALQNSYRKVREETLQGTIKNRKPDFYRRYLQTLVEKYKLPWQVFIPSDLLQESPLPHETLIQDSFTRADADALGLSWTEVTGDTDIVSNQAYTAGGAVVRLNRWEGDLASADHYAQILVKTDIGSYPGINWRYAAAAATFYHFRHNQTSGGDNLQLFKCVVGSFTQLGSNVANNPAVPYTIKGSSSGTTSHQGYIDGVSQITQTDDTAALNSNTRAGWRQGSNGQIENSYFDDFETGDSAAGLSIPVAMHHYKMMRS